MKQKNPNRWEALVPVMNDHVSWFHNLILFCFYNDHFLQSKKIEKPTSFASWFLEASRDSEFQTEVIDRLNLLHHDMIVCSEKMIAEVQQTNNRPSYEMFQSFLIHYEAFIENIRRLEKDFLIENSGYDLLTGLRNSKLLVQDIERELDRMERQGKSFVVAMARLDHYDEIKKYYSIDESNAFLKLISDLIKLCVRSFDDAYYMGHDKFVLVLKQSEMKGGISALDRLRRELERQSISYTLGDMIKPMSISCCVCDPSEAESISLMLENLELDLDKNKDRETGAVLEYYEMSPLQRFMKETGQK